MIKDSTFDEIHDCQETFRLLLSALSNPGDIVSIDNQASKLQHEHAPMMALALTLLDKETRFWVVDNELLQQSLAELTYADHQCDNADMIFVPSECTPEGIDAILAKAKPGTLVEPHRSSSLLIAVDDSDKSTPCTFKGPGIKDKRTVFLSHYARQWLDKRDMMHYEYPTGVELFFITKCGEIMSVPRRVTMEGRSTDGICSSCRRTGSN